MSCRSVALALLIFFGWRVQSWAGGPATDVNIDPAAYSDGLHYGGSPVVEASSHRLGGLRDANPDSNGDGGSSEDDPIVSLDHPGAEGPTDAQMESLKKQLMEINNTNAKSEEKQKIMADIAKQENDILVEMNTTKGTASAKDGAYGSLSLDNYMNSIEELISQGVKEAPHFEDQVQRFDPAQTKAQSNFDATGLMQILKLLALERRNAPGDHLDYLTAPPTDPTVPLPENRRDAFIRDYPGDN